MRLKLHVQIRSGHSLLAADRNGTSDPYVEAQLIAFTNQPIASEKHTTPVVKKTLNPVWDDSFVLGENYTISTEDPNAFPTLRLRAYDKNSLRRSDPLGEVIVRLTTVDPTGVQVLESRYALNNGTLEMPRGVLAQGELAVSLQFVPEKPGAAGDEEANVDAFPETNDVLDFFYEDPAYGSEPPNELRVALIRGRGLLAMDQPATILRRAAASSDPYVKFKVGGKEKARSTKKRKQLNPAWNESFSFVVDDDEFALEVIMEDHDDVSINDFMGKVTIPLHDLTSKARVRQAYRLRDKEDHLDTDRGTVELVVRWVFSDTAQKALEAQRNKISHRIGAGLGLVKAVDSSGEDSDEDGAEYSDAEDEEEAEVELTEEEQKAKDEEEKANADEILGYEIASGDYQVQVHIIEARDLKAEDLEGTSDPVVYVEAFGQKFCTAVVYKNLNPVFDERFIFDLRNLDKDDFKEGVIKLTVMDADIVTSSDVIGSYMVDAPFVYGRKDHELYRQWVGILDDTNPQDVGVQGYLKFSLAIVGPGDKLVTHDEDADIKAEQEAEAAGGFGSMVMMPPSVAVQTRYIVATVWRAEYLPITDRSGMTTGVDAFVTCKFGGMDKPVKTKVKSLKGKRSALNPMFRTELWVPLNQPCFQSKVQFEVLDYDTVGSNDVVSQFHLDWKELEKELRRGKNLHKAGYGPFWQNMYGGPPTNFVDKSGVFANARRDYLRRPERAPHYNGRLLLSFDIREELPKDKDGAPYEDFDLFMREKKGRRKVRKLQKHVPTKSYALRVVVITGQGLPWFAIRNQMSISVTCGSVTRATGARPVGRQNKDLGNLMAGAAGTKNGMTTWAEVLDLPDLELPVDDAQKPDVIVHMLRDGLPGGQRLPVCFCRFTAKELLRKGFRAGPQWHVLQEDKVINDIPDPDQFPGSVLLQIGFGTATRAEEQLNPLLSRNPHWQDPLSRLTVLRPFQVRVYVFMGRDLPAADADGGVDPYLRVSFGHQTQRTRTKRRTVDPMWFETLTFETEIPDAAYAHQVQIQLWDDDVDLDDFLGQCYLNLADALVCESKDALERQSGEDILAMMNESHWVDFFEEQPGDGAGRVLALVQITPKRSPQEEMPVPDPAYIKPPLRKSYVEILTLGMRDMIPFEMMPVQLPSLRFEIDAVSGKNADRVVQTTDTSKKPEPQNPNFLELKKFEVMLPENAFFCPPIKILAYDTRFGGFRKPLVAQGNVKLSDKAPWSPTYQPPAQQEMFETGAELAGTTDGVKLAAQGGAEARDGVEEQKGDEADDEEAKAVDSVIPLQPPSDGNATSLDDLEPLDGALDEDDDMVRYQEVVNPLSAEAAQNTRTMKLPQEYNDTGAGVFGAVVHLDKKLQKIRTKHKLKQDKDAAGRAGIPFGDFGDEDPFADDGPPKYMLDRTVLKGHVTTWEEHAKTSPFESYELFTGQGKKRKVAAVFKGIIRVVETEDAPPLFEPEAMNAILKPQQYKMRLYVLKASNLAARDQAFMGRPGRSDPYLLVRLGKTHLFNDRENFFEDVDEADFYKMIDFTCELPGASRLEVQVVDRDELLTDDLIGKTVIDLEDRWFDKRWQEFGEHTYCADAEEGIRWRAKPVENRPLFIPTTALPQGNLECWLDVMLPGEAQAFPPDDVALPPNQDFEVRVVFWKTAKVPAQDLLGGQNMTDMYARVWVEGAEVQETDTHWRAKKGKGSFNWRMKFPIQLGNRTKAMKFPYLHIQLWDKDVLKWNDIIGETMLNLGAYYRQAFKKKNLVIKVFDDVAREREAQKKKRLAGFGVGRLGLGKSKGDYGTEAPEDDGLEGVEDDGDGEIYGEDVTGDDLKAKSREWDAMKREEEKRKPKKSSWDVKSLLQRPTADLADEDDAEGNGDAGGAEGKAPRISEMGDEEKKQGSGRPGPAKKAPRAQRMSQRDEEKSLLDEDSEEEDEDDDGKDPDEEAEKQAFEGLLNSARSVLGWDLDPPDSQRLDLEATERHPDGSQTRKFMGHVWISVEIWPMNYAEGYPVGTGRGDPNQNPYLPPPVGRLQFSLNPFYMMYQICGPSLCCKILCCVACLAFLALLIFCQPVLNTLIALFVRPF